MKTQISPHFCDRKLENSKLDDWIDVFEDRVRYWLIDPASNLLETTFGFVPSLGLLLSYFEGIQTYKEGKDSRNKSKLFFRKAFIDVFSTSGVPISLLEKAANLIYEDARCGFFHDGLFRDRILFSDMIIGEMIITMPKKGGVIDTFGDIQSIVINPNRFYEAVKSHFKKYVSSIRNPANVLLRQNFENACKLKWRLHEPGPVVGMTKKEFIQQKKI